MSSPIDIIMFCYFGGGGVTKVGVMLKTHQAPDHFWKLRCRKSARRRGAKHISKSKCTKHTMLRALLEVELSKKCTPLWREAHFEVNMLKTHQLRTTFESSDAVSRGRRPANVQSTAQGGLQRMGCCPPKGCKIRPERGRGRPGAFEAKQVPQRAAGSV